MLGNSIEWRLCNLEDAGRDSIASLLAEADLGGRRVDIGIFLRQVHSCSWHFLKTLLSCV